MNEDLAGLRTEVQSMRQEILNAVAELRTEFRNDLSEVNRKLQYLCDHLLGEADQKELKRAGSRR